MTRTVVTGATTIAQIIADVAKEHGLTPDDILGRVRTAVVVAARQEAMWIARTITARPWGVLGREFKRHHSTVIHGFKAQQELAGWISAYASEGMDGLLLKRLAKTEGRG